MTDKQPEALRLADWLELHAIDGMEQKAAAELRRLHATSDELLGALKAVTTADDIVSYGSALHKARAAIAKATGDTPCQ